MTHKSKFKLGDLVEPIKIYHGMSKMQYGIIIKAYTNMKGSKLLDGKLHEINDMRQEYFTDRELEKVILHA